MYIVHIFHITFLSNTLQTILLHFDQIHKIFQISSIQTFSSFLSNIYFFTGDSNFLKAFLFFF